MSVSTFFSFAYLILCAVGCVILLLKLRVLNKSIARSNEYLNSNGENHDSAQKSNSKDGTYRSQRRKDSAQGMKPVITGLVIIRSLGGLEKR